MTQTLIPAAGYLRMSSDKQETSIDDQRSELIAYAAKHGYQIVTWYSDEGISGWKNKQRHGFHRLIADAAEGTFRVVLCWDQSRFSRFDPMEANYFWHQLRQAGVTLETIKEGKLDFESLGGWLSASVQQHAKAEYCKSLAADTVRGRRRSILEGKYVCPPPLGYRIDPATHKLVFGPANEVELVQRIFRLRATCIGPRLIAKELNAEGILSSRGSTWGMAAIQQMLRRETYLGRTVVGRDKARGKFQHLFDSVQVVEDTHPPIIDRELWEKVRQVEAMRLAKRGRRPQKLLALAGVLRCGCCGETMFGQRREGVYVCGGYRAGKGCNYCTVNIERIHKAVATKIRDVVLRGSIEALTAAIDRVLAKRRAARPTVTADAIKRQIADIDRKLEGAADRLLGVDAALVGAVQAAMQKLKVQREALTAKLAEAATAKKLPTAQQIAANAWKLDEVLQHGDSGKVRQALCQIIDRVDIQFASSPMAWSVTPGRLKWRVAGGMIHFRKLPNAIYGPDRVAHLAIFHLLPKSLEITATDFAAAG
jgi:DNA invertase Pin-like site-specific DNA recombinase